MSPDIAEIERRLWRSADQFRANSGLRPSEYSRPVLGLLFLRYAEARFVEAEKALKPRPGSRLTPGPDAFKSRGVLFLPPEARFSYLRDLPEDANLGRALNKAMTEIETNNPELADTLPKNYQEVPNQVLVELIKLLDPVVLEGDTFGKVYEFMMGEFAMQEMQKGGEFYTPASIVRLIVEIIEPYHGRILDPACGSGGMFAHSADFVREHQHEPGKELSLFGIEKTRETLRLAKMNIAIHGLSGEIKEANSYYEDPFECVGRFDFVMANPPFNVDGVDKGRLVKDQRFPFGLPTPDNANYLWIQLFYSALSPKGRAGFVMANSAADARGSELEIRKKLIETGAVDVVVSIGPNFFYTVTLPCTLWFLDNKKATEQRRDEVLFINAHHIFQQIDRAHRELTVSQIEFIANIVRLWRGSEIFLDRGSASEIQAHFPTHQYRDVPGLCRRVRQKEIEAQGWSLSPFRYVGITPGERENVDFRELLEALQEELEHLNGQAAILQSRIAQNVAELLS
jgi:type I restriction enzyme M protein